MIEDNSPRIIYVGYENEFFEDGDANLTIAEKVGVLKEMELIAMGRLQVYTLLHITDPGCSGIVIALGCVTDGFMDEEGYAFVNEAVSEQLIESDLLQKKFGLPDGFLTNPSKHVIKLIATKKFELKVAEA